MDHLSIRHILPIYDVLHLLIVQSVLTTDYLWLRLIGYLRSFGLRVFKLFSFFYILDCLGIHLVFSRWVYYFARGEMVPSLCSCGIVSWWIDGRGLGMKQLVCRSLVYWFHTVNFHLRVGLYSFCRVLAQNFLIETFFSGNVLQMSKVFVDFRGLLVLFGFHLV